jgi:hypothetical protein
LVNTKDSGGQKLCLSKNRSEKTIHQLKKRVIAMADCLNYTTSKQGQDYFFLLLIPFNAGNRLLKKQKTDKIIFA